MALGRLGSPGPTPGGGQSKGFQGAGDNQGALGTTLAGRGQPNSRWGWVAFRACVVLGGMGPHIEDEKWQAAKQVVECLEGFPLHCCLTGEMAALCFTRLSSSQGPRWQPPQAVHKKIKTSSTYAHVYLLRDSQLCHLSRRLFPGSLRQPVCQPQCHHAAQAVADDHLRLAPPALNEPGAVEGEEAGPRKP